MTLPVLATLLAAGLVPVRHPLGWLVRVHRHGCELLPTRHGCALVRAAELWPTAMWGRA